MFNERLWGDVLCVVAGLASIAGAVWFFVVSFPVSTYVTVTLLGTRGLEVDGQAPVEFNISIGVLRLEKYEAMTHAGGHVTVSYAGVRLAEGPVRKFYVAGGPRWVEATKAVSSGRKDDAPLSQAFRDQLWVDEQLDGKAEFDVALSFYDVNATTGERTPSSHFCKVGLALHGKHKATKCGEPNPEAIHLRK